MKPELLISLASLVVAGGSFVVAIYSAVRSSKLSAAQAEVQSRMLALENVRQRADVRAQKRANVTGGLRKHGGTDFRLVIQNAGPAPAKDVTFTFDGAPAAQHSIWLGNVSDDAIAVLGAGAEAEYLLAIAQQSPGKVLFEVSWENPFGERDAWSTEIKLF